jgi:hypothetical protein
MKLSIVGARETSLIHYFDSIGDISIDIAIDKNIDTPGI